MRTRNIFLCGITGRAICKSSAFSGLKYVVRDVQEGISSHARPIGARRSATRDGVEVAAHRRPLLERNRREDHGRMARWEGNLSFSDDYPKASHHSSAATAMVAITRRVVAICSSEATACQNKT